jgi:hypothetical protein
LIVLYLVVFLDIASFQLLDRLKNSGIDRWTIGILDVVAGIGVALVLGVPIWLAYLRRKLKWVRPAVWALSVVFASVLFAIGVYTQRDKPAGFAETGRAFVRQKRKPKPEPPKPDPETGNSSRSVQQPTVTPVSTPAAHVGEGGWCELPYSPVDPAAPVGEQPRPHLPFTIEYGPRSFSGVALVYSRSDAVSFPLSYARALEVDLSQSPRRMSRGLGGLAAEYPATVTLHVTPCGREFHYPVTVSFSEGLEGIGLLGQNGFLDQFHVEFRKAEGIFAIQLPAEPSAAPEAKPEPPIVAGSLTAPPQPSAQWRFVSADSDGRNWYIDVQTIAATSAARAVWVQYVKQNGDFTLMRWEFDDQGQLGHGRYRVWARTDYNSVGVLVDSFQEPTLWQEISPDTTEERLYSMTKAAAPKAAVVTAQSEGDSIRIGNSSLGYVNVRERPDISSPVVAKVYPGEMYTLGKVVNGWYQVKDRGGWVAGKYVIAGSSAH